MSDYKCSFCNRNLDQASIIIWQDCDHQICADCILRCVERVNDHIKATTRTIRGVLELCKNDEVPEPEKKP